MFGLFCAWNRAVLVGFVMDDRTLTSDARREAVDVGYGNTAGRLQGTVYVFREPNAWPTTKKAPSPDVFAAAG